MLTAEICRSACHKLSVKDFRAHLCSKCRGKYKKYRQISRPLHWKVALVTGIRSQLGKAVALRLLNDGATVVGISRFPKVTEQLFSQEATFEKWKENLHIYQVDLQILEDLIQFLSEFKSKYKRVDIIVNAATFADEGRFFSNSQSLKEQEDSLNVKNDARTYKGESDNPFYTAELVNTIAPFTILNELSSLLKVRYPVFALDNDDDGDLKPTDRSYCIEYKQEWFRLYKEIGVANPTGKPLSKVRSAQELFDWPQYTRRNTISHLSTEEKLLSHVAGRRKKVIVNLALADRAGTANQKYLEPAHLVVSKASLDMITCSLGNELAQYDCFIYSVDPGWFIDHRENLPHVLPLSIEDATARVLQPVYDNIFPFDCSPEHYGCLLRNFIVVPWPLPTIKPP